MNLKKAEEQLKKHLEGKIPGKDIDKYVSKMDEEWAGQDVIFSITWLEWKLKEILKKHGTQ